MRVVNANGKALMLDESGFMHGPFSLFLNDKYDNPSTWVAVAVGLRLLQVFLRNFDISLHRRALEGRCLHTLEVGWLANLAYRPVEELETMRPRMLMRLAKAQDVAHRDRPGAVTASTASARLVQIGEFLDWYFKNILDARIRSAQARVELRARYETTVNTVKGKIRGGNNKHPTQIRSLPGRLYQRLMSEAYANAEDIFCAESGKTSKTVMRDRAVFLLACEGLRPGAIGNIALQDFNGDQIGIVDNVGRRGESPTEGTPRQKGARSNKQSYTSSYVMTLWPWTVAAIREYIKEERSLLLEKGMHNPSKGFLFLGAQHAGPIKNRRTIGLIFERAKRRLLAKGLLARSPEDHYVKAQTYEFSSYTLRHSAAAFYMAEKGNSERTKSEMKDRFGWSVNSFMPDRYGRRANLDAASIDKAELWNSMKADRLKKLESNR